MYARGRLLITSVLVATLAACGDSATGPAEVSVTGVWTGRATVNPEFEPNFRLTLQQADDATITGSGHLETDGGDYSVDVAIGAGILDFPNVYFAILNPSSGDILFTGTLDRSGDRIEGRLSGTGMDDVELVLNRQ